MINLEIIVTAEDTDEEDREMLETAMKKMGIVPNDCKFEWKTGYVLADGDGREN